MKLAIFFTGALLSANAQQVRINEIQLVGTHNSYTPASVWCAP